MMVGVDVSSWILIPVMVVITVVRVMDAMATAGTAVVDAAAMAVF